MQYLYSVWTWTETHAMAMLSLLVTMGLGKWIQRFLTGDMAAAFVKGELEKFRADLHSNSVTSQIKADDAIVDILEATIPEVLHDMGDEIGVAIQSGNLSSVDWKTFGKALWAKVEPQVVGGVNDYLKNSSFQDGETLAAQIAARFFKTQAVVAKGLIKV